MDHAIEISADGGDVGGYITPGSAEQVQNWLQNRHGIYDQNILARLQSIPILAFLNNINVEEDKRGQGVGNELLDVFLSRATFLHAAAIVLIADTAESQAEGFDLIKWYEGRGFETILDTDIGPLMVYEI